MWLRSAYPHRPVWHETIYQAIHHGTRRGLHRRLTARLCMDRSMHRLRRRTDPRTLRFAAPKLLIDRRPAMGGKRVRIGQLLTTRPWEILGRATPATVFTAKLSCRNQVDVATSC